MMREVGRNGGECGMLWKLREENILRAIKILIINVIIY